MSLSSLGFRIFLLSLMSILLALVATTFVLNQRFNVYFEDRIYNELEQHLEQLTTNLKLNETGEISIDPLVDRRFEQPFSGLYWQVQPVDGQVVMSRSLWGGEFDVPDNVSAGVQFRIRSSSPIGSGLLVLGWPVLLGDEGQQRMVVLSVAIDDTEVTTAASGFRKFLIGWLAIMFAGLLLAAWVQVRIGLAPLKLLRHRIGSIRAGTEARLLGQFPSEVQPLVEEVNELLDLHDATLSAARTRASDLAHGLKTPLTVMRILGQDLAEAGQAKKAAEIEEQVGSMHRFIERELARVGTSPGMNAQIPGAEVLLRMLTSIKKLPDGEALDWQVDISDDLTTPFDAHDLSELAGNLLDNARKWAANSVAVSAGNQGEAQGWINIADDGPGIPDDRLNDVLKRGHRLDPNVSGTGLGLTIARDLAVQKGAKITLSQSKLGGLNVKISW